MKTKEDLLLLPIDIRNSAKVESNGEVSWRIEDGEEAINALASSGFTILGLDVRRTYPDGSMLEVPWGSFEPDMKRDTGVRLVKCRDAALQSLAREDISSYGDRVLITWH